MNSLSFRLTTSSEPVAAYIAEVLTMHLQAGKRVVWLLSGGSAIDAAVAVSKKLQGVDVQRLSITLADERLGPVGHVDSNWAQLEKSGFSVPGAELLPVLFGGDLVETARRFENTLQRTFRETDYRLALLGIGPDGHIAGILPGTEAVTAPGLATGYVAAQYKRVTMTVQALARLDEAVVFAMGEAKKPIFDTLQQDMPIDAQPAQALKAIPKVTIFSDQIGDSV